jgi:hypothetical protein
LGCWRRCATFLIDTKRSRMIAEAGSHAGKAPNHAPTLC